MSLHTANRTWAESRFHATQGKAAQQAQADARTRSKAPSPAKVAAERKAAALARVVAGLRREFGAVIPPAEGGALFRDLADALTDELRVEVTPAQVSDAAARAGLWPWHPASIMRAVCPEPELIDDEEEEETP